MKKYNFLRNALWVASAVVVLASCKSDAWDSHYSIGAGVPTQTLAQKLESMPEYSKFVATLKTTYMYNGTKQTVSTYWDLLDESQFITVWAPKNDALSDTEWDVYMSDNMDTKDHLKIGTEFIMNHMARFAKSVTSKSDERITMMSGKSYQNSSTSISNLNYIPGMTNIRCTNGLLHEIDGCIRYLPSIYEYITDSEDYQEVFGKWLKSYTKYEIDPEKSVAAGVNEEGNMEYVDSVLVVKSEVLDKFGLINEEDSNYLVILPTPELFAKIKDSIGNYFVYPQQIEDRETKVEYYTMDAMMTDMFFNMNNSLNSSEDSVVSTQYSKTERLSTGIPYHVYYKPNGTGGLFDMAVDTISCSNGNILVVDQWPFQFQNTFFRPIKVEAEDEVLSATNMNFVPRTLNYYQKGELVRTTRVMEINKGAVHTWELYFPVSETLKGKYKVRTVFVRNTTLDKPYKIRLEVRYRAEEEDAKLWATPARNPLSVCSDNTKASDTITSGIVEFTTCNYMTNQNRAYVKINSIANGVSAVGNVWLDCIILDPVIE